MLEKRDFLFQFWWIARQMICLHCFFLIFGTLVKITNLIRISFIDNDFGCIIKVNTNHIIGKHIAHTVFRWIIYPFLNEDLQLTRIWSALVFDVLPQKLVVLCSSLSFVFFLHLPLQLVYRSQFGLQLIWRTVSIGIVLLGSQIDRLWSTAQT